VKFIRAHLAVCCTGLEKDEKASANRSGESGWRMHDEVDVRMCCRGLRERRECVQRGEK
jgi:hypothetical protein